MTAGIPQVDVRGLSCPEPALLVRRALLEAGMGTVEVRVGAGAPHENVIRTALRLGWRVRSDEADGGDFRLVLEK